MKDSIAIIPARGGSKRIPGKNLRPFLGRPIIDYPIQTCLTSGLFERVIVSTDSEAIALEAFKMGVESIQRPKSISGDKATVVMAIRHVLDCLPIYPKFVCVLFPTSVFADEGNLRVSHYRIVSEQCDGVASMVPYSHPIERAFWMDAEEQEMTMINPKNEFDMTQAFRPSYHDAAQFY